MIRSEREGFEPSMRFPPYSLSRGAPSAARPPLQVAVSYQKVLVYSSEGSVYRRLLLVFLDRW